MLACRANPSAPISSAQKGSTGQKPCTTKTIAKARENKHVPTKNRRAVVGVSEQFGASSMRSSMTPKHNSSRRGQETRGVHVKGASQGSAATPGGELFAQRLERHALCRRRTRARLEGSPGLRE